GFPLSAASVSRLSALDIDALDLPGISQALLIDRSDLPAARAWSRSLGERGAKVTYRALPGFVEMMLTDPQFASLPLEMLAATHNWLSALAAASRLPWPARDAGTFVSRSAVLTLRGASPGDSGSADATITERPVFFGAAAPLFGIVTEPDRKETRRRVVILLNAGATYHIGSSRMYVSMARRWAQRGYYVLRMDLSGIGESRPRAGCDDNNVFPPGAIEDIR